MTTPIFDINRGFKIWNIKDIYMGSDSPAIGRIVPNIDDAVIDWNRGFFRVTAVDNVFTPPDTPPTYVPILEAVDLSLLSRRTGNVHNDNPLVTYQSNELALIFINTLVTPNTVSVDGHYTIYGSQTAFVKLFKGVDINPDTGIVLSQVYNGSGDYIGENVELELVFPNNPAIKRPPVFNTDISLYDGEVVTLVAYTQQGGPYSIQRFTVVNSSAIRGLDNNTVNLTDIVLVSSMIDQVETDLINVPANLPINGSDFQAKLIYSDGTEILIAVGSSKCKLLGIDGFNTSISGPTSTVVLTYYPSNTEAAISLSNPAIAHLSKVYRIRTINNALNSSFKVYIVPKYNNLTNRFTLEYYLTTLDYSTMIKLNTSQYTVRRANNTPMTFTPDSPPQNLVISVVMSTVFPSGYANYTFVQTVVLKLGTTDTYGWTIDYIGDGTSVFGADAYFEFSLIGQQNIKIQSSAVSKEDWLAKLWLPIAAIYDSTLRLAPPTPTHFQLRYKGALSDIKSISANWNNLIPSDFTDPWVNNGTVEIVWLFPSVDLGTFLILGISPVMIKNTLV